MFVVVLERSNENGIIAVRIGGNAREDPGGRNRAKAIQSFVLVWHRELQEIRKVRTGGFAAERSDCRNGFADQIEEAALQRYIRDQDEVASEIIAHPPLGSDACSKVELPNHTFAWANLAKDVRGVLGGCPNSIGMLPASIGKPSEVCSD